MKWTCTKLLNTLGYMQQLTSSNHRLKSGVGNGSGSRDTFTLKSM